LGVIDIFSRLELHLILYTLSYKKSRKKFFFFSEVGSPKGGTLRSRWFFHSGTSLLRLSKDRYSCSVIEVVGSNAEILKHKKILFETYICYSA